MEVITIGFSKSRKKFPIGSWLIRLYQGTPYSHVYLKFYSESLNRTLVYEAVGSGVRFIGSKQWESHAEEVKSYTINISKESKVKLLQFCVDNAGADYAYSQNLGIIVADIFNMKKNPFTKGLQCSETLGEILSLEGYKLHKDANLLTPLDIDIILKTQVQS
jgi:uncharacterized protein YycO